MKGKGLIAVFEGLPVLLLIEHCKNQGLYMDIKIQYGKLTAKFSTVKITL